MSKKLSEMTSDERKQRPIARGVLDYFPDALAEIALVSKTGNDQHNPGQPLHWAKEKSTDHADCIIRHLLERGTIDTDGMRHSAKVAWRALALLQIELETERQGETITEAPEEQSDTTSPADSMRNYFETADPDVIRVVTTWEDGCQTTEYVPTNYIPMGVAVHTQRRL